LGAEIEKQFCVYIVASGLNGTLYIGVTSNLAKRVWEHKEKMTRGFTAKYSCDQLVYFELFDNAEAAITREKQLKEWRRSWKIEMIEKSNPAWRDLYSDIAT
jgi:putative endonuclease